MRARDVLQLGFHWKIGNGSQIKIWEDQWLPKRSTFKVISPKPQKTPYNFICDLIDENTKTWKRDLIDNPFLPKEASIIKAIPLNLHHPHNKIIWDGAKFGEYIVKSDYFLLKQRVRVEVEEPSNPNNSKAIWRAIWTANFPNKIKVFNWRALHYILPTKVNLFERKISSTYSL